MMWRNSRTRPHGANDDLAGRRTTLGQYGALSNMRWDWLVRLWHSLSTVGLLLGSLFFAASLTPTLVPRTFLTQGVLSGFSFAAGYGIGVLGNWLWTYLEVPRPQGRILRNVTLAAAIVCAIIVIAFFWRWTQWQNSIRQIMELEPLAGAQPLGFALIALVTLTILIALARLFQLVFHFVSTRLHRFLPKRVSNVLGAIVGIALFWSVINGILVRALLHLADSSFREYDALIEPETSPPTAPLKTGSSASLIRWDDLGRAGREFISSEPSSADLHAFSGKDTREPVRVYVGLRSGETPQARANLALEELKRVGGFDRSVLIVVTPTGTGWIDPGALDSVEYLQDGDVASVAIQYSYLPSWLTLLVDPGYGADTAQALFSEIYRYWTSLPRDHRPRLYLHGLSLGALNSAQSVQLFEIIGDPIDGALWSGPPYSSEVWRSFMNDRNPGTPAWLPQFRDGSFVRFMNQDGVAVAPDSHWGPMRIVYLQYASDPVTFFDYQDLYREPDWMIPPRGPDVSPDLRWYPVVTLFQLTLDMLMATTTPPGYGHVFAPAHYVDAWIEVTDVKGWSADDIARLKRHLAKDNDHRGDALQ
ncbi:alpha/beta hydrolase [Dongia soli]|uniref:Alpha/beta-hydrolase family protein n=1 Tax=Dongia soli TaxID=600628 RepID=A0ABU5EHA2_9PROT|nr:alpha/beta-hydrolase family protein [Dongia soli]MDY0885722.1 alpha/beta-hydrolase family protein [Dongia soli]